MLYQKEIETRLKEKFDPSFLQVMNESEKHRGHANGPKGEDLAETHFFVKMMSSFFKNLSRLERHRQVYQILADLMPTPIHALRLELLSADEI